MDPLHITEFASERYFSKLRQLNEPAETTAQPLASELPNAPDTPQRTTFTLPLRGQESADNINTSLSLRPTEHKKPLLWQDLIALGTSRRPSFTGGFRSRAPKTSSTISERLKPTEPHKHSSLPIQERPCTFHDLFLSLPTELVVQIIAPLPLSVILALRLVSRGFHSLITLNESPIATYHSQHTLPSFALQLYPSPGPNEINLHYICGIWHRLQVAAKLADQISNLATEEIFIRNTAATRLEFQPQHSRMRRRLLPLIFVLFHYFETYRDLHVRHLDTGGTPLNRQAFVLNPLEWQVMNSYTDQMLLQTHQAFPLVISTFSRSLRPASYVAYLEKGLKGYIKDRPSDEVYATIFTVGGLRQAQKLWEMREYNTRRDAVDRWYRFTNLISEKPAVSRSPKILSRLSIFGRKKPIKSDNESLPETTLHETHCKEWFCVRPTCIVSRRQESSNNLVFNCSLASGPPMRPLQAEQLQRLLPDLPNLKDLWTHTAEALLLERGVITRTKDIKKNTEVLLDLIRDDETNADRCFSLDTILTNTIATEPADILAVENGGGSEQQREPIENLEGPGTNEDAGITRRADTQETIEAAFADVLIHNLTFSQSSSLEFANATSHAILVENLTKLLTLYANELVKEADTLDEVRCSRAFQTHISQIVGILILHWPALVNNTETGSSTNEPGSNPKDEVALTQSKKGRVASVDLDNSKAQSETFSLHELKPQGRQFMTDSAAFRRLVEVWPRWAFPDIEEYIRQTIQENTSFLKGSDVVRIRCGIDWQLMKYYKLELFGSSSNLIKALTVTGSPACSQISTCQDYVIQTWGSKGLKILEGVIKSLEQDSFKTNISSRHRITFKNLKNQGKSVEEPHIIATGPMTEVIETITLLAWLTATFRMPKLGGLTMSNINFQPEERTNLRDNSLNGCFRISLSSIEDYQSILDYDSSEKCWLPLFQEGVLACGFPVAKREKGGHGLEIPFHLMSLFAGVRGSMAYENKTVLVGPSKILFPTKLVGNGVQWHYVEADDKQVLADALDLRNEQPELENIEHLSTLRTFLGYYKHALVYAGTKEGANSSIGNSLVPKSSSRLELAREGTLSAGFGHGGSGAMGAKFLLPRSLQVSLSGNRHYVNRLESASERAVLVYDLTARTAWLVTELSMVLHMVHKYLNRPKAQYRGKRLGIASTSSCLPYAEPSADGGSAAFDVIQRSGDLELYVKQEDGKPQEFWSEIDQLLKDFATIRTQENLKRASAGWKIRKPRLQGWDFNDLASKEETVIQRELPSDNVESSWWSLAEADDVVTLFGSGFGQLIRPDMVKSKPYKGWETVPDQAELLTASMPCLWWLARKCNQAQSCAQLTSELFWHAPTGRVCGPKSGCTDGCLYVQELRTRGLFDKMFGPSDLNPPGRRLCENEAIIFGDIKYYHHMGKLSSTARMGKECCPSQHEERVSILEVR